MLAMGVIGSVRGGTKGIFSTRSRSSRSQPPAVALRSPSVSRPLPERLPGPRCFPGVFKPAPGSSAGQDWLPWPARVGPPLPPLLSTHPVDRVSRAWHGGPIWACALRLLLTAVPRVGVSATESSHPSPQIPTRSQREGSLFVPVTLPHPSLSACWGRGLCHPAQTAPSPTSGTWVCLGSHLPLCPASSPFIRCHGHDQHLDGEGKQGKGSLWHQASKGERLRVPTRACAPGGHSVPIESFPL